MADEKETGGGGASLALTYTPAVIACDFHAMQERLYQLLEPYEGLDEAALAKMPLKEAKACRAGVNRVINDVEEGRKGVKREYNAPLREFEARVRELLAPAYEARSALDRRVKAEEARAREERREALQEAYESLAPALAAAVPLDRLLDPRWLNASFGQKKAERELGDKAAALARDWETVKGMAASLPYWDVAERVLFSTLSLQEALDAAREAEERAARIDALRAEVDEIRAAQAAPAPEPEPEQQAAPEPQGECEPEPLRRCVIECEVTDAQYEELVGFIKSRGIHGRARIEERS